MGRENKGSHDWFWSKDNFDPTVNFVPIVRLGPIIMTGPKGNFGLAIMIGPANNSRD